MKIVHHYFVKMIDDKGSMQLIVTGLLVASLSQMVVSQKQYFTVQPRNTFALLGESATFYCRIADKTGIVFWEKDSQIFAHENRPQLGSSDSTPRAIFGNTTLGEYNLQLTGVAEKDKGIYACKVTSSGGSQSTNLTSQPARLEVVDFPMGEFPVCVMSIREALTEGDVVELTCAYLNNSTTRTALTWERMDTPALLSNTKQVSRDGYFIRRHTITLSLEDDMTTYQCIASTPGKETRSCTTGTLYVQHRPVISISPTVLTAKTGDNVRFTCHTSSANPSLVSYQWYYRGRAVTVVSEGIDLLENAEGDPQILINNLVVPTGEVSVICEVTNDVGSSRAIGLIRQEDAELVYISTEEILLWLIPCSVIVAVVVLLLFLAIITLDLCPCCRTFCNKKGGRRRALSPDRSLNSTWSAAENYGMSPSPTRSRRLSEPDSTDFYVTRAIRTPPPIEQSRNTAHHNSTGESHPHSNHTPSPNHRTPSSNYRTTSPNYYQSTPNGRLDTNRIESEENPGHQYQQRRPRNRDRFRRGGSPQSAGMNRGSSHAEYSEIQTPTRNSVLSDSGLDFAASSSIDSRSPTPRDRVVYAQIMRNRAEEAANNRSQSRDSPPRQETPSPDVPSGIPLPTSSTYNNRLTLEVPGNGIHRARSVELPPM